MTLWACALLCPAAAGGGSAARRQAQEATPAAELDLVLCQEIRQSGDCSRYRHMCPDTCGRADGGAFVTTK